MKIPLSVVIYILKRLICDDRVMGWLQDEAHRTGTHLDDYALEAISKLLCGSERQ
jgi:hypothetical protein